MTVGLPIFFDIDTSRVRIRGGRGPMIIAVRVRPNAKTEEVIQEPDGFSVKVKEPPVEGRANRAVVKLMAKHLKVPESHVRIVKGLKSKNKIIEVV